MKHVKSLICLLLILVMTLSACGTPSKEPVPDTPAAPEETAPVDSPAAETAVPDKEEVSDTYTFTDGRGKEVTVKRNPERVVCTYGSYCPLWYDCGGKLVYRIHIYDSYSPLPQELVDVPVLAEGETISAEVVLAAEPDLVIMNNSKSDLEMAELLEAAGIPCLVYGYKTFEEYLDLVKIFTELTERPDLYEVNATDVKARVDAVREKIGDHSCEGVLIMPSTGGPSFTSASTMCGSMLVDLNMKLLSYPDGDTTQEKYEFSMEKLLELDPQFILTAGGGEDQEAAAQRVLELPGFTELTAYKEGRYRHLDVSMYMYKPNARFADAYEQLAAFLYPDLF